MLFLSSVARAELKADQLLLVVNGNAGDSVRLAEYYAKARLVPDGRIVRLDLPAQEEISFDLYERNVVPVIRRFIRENKLESQIKCLVTFYGTPIRIKAPEVTTELKVEIDQCKADLLGIEKQVAAEVGTLEQYVKSVQPQFQPLTLTGDARTAPQIEQLAARMQWAVQALDTTQRQTTDLTARALMIGQLKNTWQTLMGEAGVVQVFGSREIADPSIPEQTKLDWKARADKLAPISRILQNALDRRFDATERARVREITKEHLGLIPYGRVLEGHATYYGTDQAGAAFDSELALLWSDWYPRDRWLLNPLHVGAVGYRGSPIMMTARIDGPDEFIPAEMILASLRTEKTGLKGTVVLDSRGLPYKPGDPYSEYDNTIRELAKLLREKTTLRVVLDERGDLLPDDSQKGVAIYAGWYSPGQYKPTCRFVTGAVGYHIASWEMISMRDPKARGWVPNLIKAGVVGTTGPVAEPYLFAFPDADAFFPLLFTGELTLAEVYWKTQKLVSWQMSLVGDPLYRPFAKEPPLRAEDLPEKLKPAIPRLRPGVISGDSGGLSTQPTAEPNR